MTGSIVLVGDGHGALAAYRGLARRFEGIGLLTDDDDLLDLAGSSSLRYRSLEEFAGDAVVLAGCRTILSPRVLAQHTVYNVHYSLLPRYRGLHSVVWAMLNDEPEIGLTVHRVREEVDAGEIAYQFAQPMNDDLTSADLMQLFNEHVATVLGDVIHDCLAGEIALRKQDEAQATWVPRRNRDDCLIDYGWSNRYLALFFRALVEPYPLPQIIGQTGRFEVLSHRLIDRPYHGGEGRVVHRDGEGAWIKVRDGLLVVQELRDGEGRVVNATEMLQPGERLA